MKYMDKKKSLEYLYPQVAKLWDYEKNNVTPDHVAAHCNLSYFWKCPKCGYSWKAKVANFTRRGIRKCYCPVCLGRTVMPRYNDLLTTHPNIAKEWHPTKNGGLKPNQVTCGSGKPVWWLCPRGHEYKASPLHRCAEKGTNCPICNSGRQTSFCEQAIYFYLKKVFPDTINRYKSDFLGKFELDIYIPCRNIAFEYDGIHYHKSNKSLEKEIRKYQICKEHNIKLFRLKEAPYCDDDKLTCDYVYSKKNLDLIPNLEETIKYVFDFLSVSSDIDIKRDQIEILNYLRGPLKRSFASEYPKLAKDWHPTKNGNIKPDMVTPKAGKKFYWICPDCGNEYLMSPSLRSNGCGCPKCGINKMVSNRHANYLKKHGHLSDPKLLKEWNYELNGDLKPTDVTPCGENKVWWICSKCGYVWQAKVSNRVHGRGCPTCANKVH